MGRWVAVLVLGAVGGAALTAPAVNALVAHWLPGAGWPFSRVFDRLAVLFALVLIAALRKRLGIERLVSAWRAEGWWVWLRQAPVGFVAAGAPALAVLPLVVAHTPVGWAGRTWQMALWVLVRAVPGAVLVSALEESFFRVTVFGGLARRWPMSVALGTSSALYGAVHFITPDRSFVATSASPLEGLRYLGSVLGRLLTTPTLVAVAGLSLMGAVLCVVLWRTGSLALCVGMHAGWFAVTKVAIYLSTLEAGAPAAGSIGKRLLLLGSPWVWLAAVLTAVFVLLQRPPGRESRAESRK
ncbi:MAG: CPBP family intramembrane metalloprotease [Thermoanaerobaculaceae bacterium]|mgnify:CR=1 FL=1|nr:CPBP family intramembrane metalloprotease [Thermoanaerobaculaceae bacterium]MDI9621266.1 CPBP family intramembrane metalloprotease [Acidobacteriota bacterium]NLH11913.1 CPBP family intramembrane metalloprotease [Holophagae bacterium]HPW54202.1 CPBP family intramembrane metalloprotease [Thermoanaerobaculaceae bacterium]